jgi:hypothetical protein
MYLENGQTRSFLYNSKTVVKVILEWILVFPSLLAFNTFTFPIGIEQCLIAGGLRQRVSFCMGNYPSNHVDRKILYNQSSKKCSMFSGRWIYSFIYILNIHNSNLYAIIYLSIHILGYNCFSCWQDWFKEIRSFCLHFTSYSKFKRLYCPGKRTSLSGKFKHFLIQKIENSVYNCFVNFNDLCQWFMSFMTFIICMAAINAAHWLVD